MDIDSDNLPNQTNRTFIEQATIQERIMKVYDRYYHRCMLEIVKNEHMNNDNTSNSSGSFNQIDQNNIDDDGEEIIEDANPDELFRELHAIFLYKSLISVGATGRVFDTGQPWMIYWNIHGLELLDHEFFNIKDPKLQKDIIKFLGYCQSPTGGFCGGHYQIPHLASTYAAILSILTVGTEEAYNLIDRKKMYDFLLRMRNPELKGSFLMHDKGECDMRATYIAIIIAKVLNILTDELKDNTGNFIASCQTYEGGIGGGPFQEAHGGYTFCGYAALCALDEAYKLDTGKLLYWTTEKQMANEGGFNGRTNKVVDCCYSFWQCAIFKLIADVTKGKATYDHRLLYNQLSVQMYILVCCQDEKYGGLKDKPGKFPDFYHTCYGLAGLSISQELINNSNQERIMFKNKGENALKRIDPIYNVEENKLKKAMDYFKNLPKIV